MSNSVFIRRKIQRKYFSWGHFWEKGFPSGVDPYLCTNVLNDLDEHILAKAEDKYYLSQDEVLEKALFLKKNRRKNGIIFLNSLGCISLAFKLNHEPVERPSRPWVNDIANKLQMDIKNEESLMKIVIFAVTGKSIRRSALYIPISFEIFILVTTFHSM